MARVRLMRRVTSSMRVYEPECLQESNIEVVDERTALSSCSLLTLIAIPKNRDLVVEVCELDVGIPLLLDGVEWANLIFASVPDSRGFSSECTDTLQDGRHGGHSPVYLQVLCLAFWPQDVV